MVFAQDLAKYEIKIAEFKIKILSVYREIFPWKNKLYKSKSYFHVKRGA